MSKPSLLTAHLFVFRRSASAAAQQQPIKALVKRLQEREIVSIIHSHDADPREGAGPDPSIYVTIGGKDSDFAALFNLPLFERNRWLHFSDAAAIQPGALFYCWLSATDPLPKPKFVPPSTLSAVPLVSVFTAAYRSGARIQRPFRSLLGQTYQNWEWIIMDDSGDDDATYQAHIRPLTDRRVRKFRQEKQSGYIGTVKRAAAGLCTGEILVELDHDDELTPDCLERLVDAFRRHPECGFAFGEAAEVYEETMQPKWYGWDSGFGFLIYWRQHDAVTNRWQDVPRTPSLNWKTIRHLVGLPNHPRAWTRECYFLLGAHRVGLSVADDYDLLVRTFLSTRMLRVQHLVYLQYTNTGGSNQTLQRNAQIQIMVAEIEHYYKSRIDARFTELQLPSLQNSPYRRIWTCAEGDPQWRAGELLDADDPDKKSLLFVIPFGDTQVVMPHLLDALRRCGEDKWRSCELVVVGNVPEAVLETAASRAPPGAIRWWKTEQTWPSDDCLRYGRMLTTGPKREEFGPQHTKDAVIPQASHVPLSLADAFAPAAPADKDRDRLSVLLHLRERFGYRRYLQIGCDHDEVFAQMTGFDIKAGIDPQSGGTQRQTSDAFFAANSNRREEARERFDLIFIQGPHEYTQVLRDVQNAIACLTPGGTVVLHNCMPFAEAQQIMPRPMPPSFWTGDVWKAIFALRRRTDVDVAVGRFDWGVGVLRVRPNVHPLTALAGEPVEWTWETYCAHRDDGLKAMRYAELQHWIDEEKEVEHLRSAERLG